MLKLISACGSNVGRLRKNNEDNFCFNGMVLPSHSDGTSKPLVYNSSLSGMTHFGVFDGMGGEANGEIASFIAATEFQAISARTTIQEIEHTFQRANTKICKEARRLDCGVMGTTAAVLTIDPTSVCAINVGDSKIYRFFDNNLIQISTDHTDEELMHRYGIYGRKPRLTQHLGIEPHEMIIEPSVWSTGAVENDCYLICSDGLSDMLSDNQIKEYLSIASPAVCVESLIESALQRGGKDNITVIVVKTLATNSGK